MKRIKTKSGLSGWQERLHKVYHNYEEFVWYCENYGIHKQLGFKSIKRCYNANPLMSGTVVPGQLKRIKE